MKSSRGLPDAAWCVPKGLAKWPCAMVRVPQVCERAESAAVVAPALRPERARLMSLLRFELNHAPRTTQHASFLNEYDNYEYKRCNNREIYIRNAQQVRRHVLHV